MKQRERLCLVDVLKGVAIVGIILYHTGILKYGYLGVEIFFVISGFLTTLGIAISYRQNCDFNYFDFLLKRVLRLWPLVLAVSLVSLVCGYFWQLPDNFKNTTETVVGTIGFVNNFVQYITSSNYWDVSNDYKPLMHTWYLGVIFQYYLLFPLAVKLLSKFVSWEHALNYILWIGLIMSLTIYILPFSSDASKFYLLPARFFEFGVGGLLAINTFRGSQEKYDKVVFGLLMIILLSLGINCNFNASQYRLLTMLLLVALLIKKADVFQKQSNRKCFQMLAWLGKASLSLYLWHQVVLAFYRYVVNDNFTISSYLVVLSVSISIGTLTYRLVEEKLTKVILSVPKYRNVVLLFCLFLAFSVVFVSVFYYKHNGIVRNVPELDISTDNFAYQCQQYNARILAFDKNFPTNNKKNIFVLGDSFGRDWINVLIEAGFLGKYNISYHQEADSVAYKRILQSDIVFIANNSSFKYYSLLPLIQDKIYFRIGQKHFGSCNGIVYNNHRYGKKYYQQEFGYNDSLDVKEKRIFGKHYIDMMSVLRQSDGMYPVFTPSHRFFSHDQIHLTKAGAKRFAELLKPVLWQIENL